ncbi:hypothetical protein MPSEU_000862500 [Mayamaea pseudoterrestris]|nr:hypothetical protein MPSEU_000862500 [Mayamaea pseudoterrestris]
MAPSLDESRRKAEFSLAGELLRTVLEQGRAFQAAASSSDEQNANAASTSDSPRRRSHNKFLMGRPDVTATEIRVFGVRTYHNWTAGALAGLGTFVVLFGGLRWNASRRALKTITAPIKRQEQQIVHEFEGSKFKTKGTISQNQSPPLTIETVLSDDVMAQIQFMIVGGFSIVVSSVVARLASDRKQFMRDLGELPLQPGKSRFCYAMCPAVIDKLESKLGSEEETGVDANVQTLVSDPVTLELESMLRLVSNCRTRMDYEREHGGTPENPVDVPEPGVPRPYVSLDSGFDRRTDQSNERSWFR